MSGSFWGRPRGELLRETTAESRVTGNMLGEGWFFSDMVCDYHWMEHRQRIGLVNFRQQRLYVSRLI